MNRRTKLALARDKNIKAQHAGKRTSADGNTYYEYRENRSDVNRTKRFGKGGDLWTPLDFTSIEEYFDYINDSLINGNRTQVKELYNDMDESQKRQFFRYANMQEGMFDEVVDYINENVREYANGGGIENVRINTKLEALQETESKDFNDKSPYYAKVGTIGTVIDIIGSKYKVQLDNLDTILVHKLDIGDYWGIYNFEYRKGDDVYILENYNKNPYAAPIKKEGKVIDFDGKDVSVEWSDGSASTLNQRFLYKEKYAKGGGLNNSHLDDLYNKSNKNVQGALELYAGELGIYNMFYGHKVDASKKAKYKKAQKYLESKYMAKGGGVEKNTDFYLVVNLDERGEYSADVRNPKDEVVYSIEDSEQMNSLIQDGFLKYKADEDLNRLTKYLMDLGIIPNNSQIYSEEEFDNKIREEYTEGDEDEEFVVHGHYTVSNSGGYEIMLSDSGDAARVRDAFGSENPETSDWLEIEYVTDEEGEPDEDGNLPSEPVIDPEGYNIPLNLVMRSHFKKGGNLKKTKYIVFYVSEEGQMRERLFGEDEKELADDFSKKVNGSVSPIKLAKGGAVKQKGAQYKIDGYGSGDRKRKAKPVGFRYERIRDPKTGKLRVVTKEDKKYYATPTQKEIKAYKDGDVTARKMLGFENRADHSDKEPVRFSRKFAKGGSVTIGEHKATFKVKYSLDGEKQKDGYIVSVLTPSQHAIDYYLLYDKSKKLVKKISHQESQELVKDKKIILVKRYDVPNEKQKSNPDTEVKDMSYAERREWIKENIVPNLKSAVNYWNSYNHGSFDSNDKKSEKEFLDKVRESAMYGSTEAFEKATSLKVDDSGWGLESPEGEEFEQVASDNTYNSSYLGLFNWNFRIYSVYDVRFVLIAHPHMGGDVRGNYGDPIFLEGESKEDVLMKFYEEVVDGKHSVNLEFKDGTSVTFDAQQDSDVNYYELYDDGSKKKKIKLGSPVEILTTTFKTFGGHKGDDFVEEIVDEFERSKDKNKKKMSNGGGVGEELMGGQPNTSKPSGYKLISKKGKEIIVSDDGGKTKELWYKNNGFVGYTLHYEGNQYEFVESFANGGGIGEPIAYTHYGHWGKRAVPIYYEKEIKGSTFHLVRNTIPKGDKGEGKLAWDIVMDGVSMGTASSFENGKKSIDNWFNNYAKGGGLRKFQEDDFVIGIAKNKHYGDKGQIFGYTDQTGNPIAKGLVVVRMLDNSGLKYIPETDLDFYNPKGVPLSEKNKARLKELFPNEPHNLPRYQEEYEARSSKGKMANGGELSSSMIGKSLSSGTLKSEHLIESFMDFLQSVKVELGIEEKVNNLQEEVNALEKDEDGDFVGESEETATYILNEDIFDLLNNIAPEGTSFGSHEGNGSDFGFWEYENDEEFAKGGGVSDTKKIKKRLEYLRKELRAERISQGELIELQSLSKYIDKGDVELLEAAGVPEFEDDDEVEEEKFRYKDIYSSQGGMTFETGEEVEEFIKRTKPFIRKELKKGNFVVVYNGKEYFIGEKLKINDEYADGGGVGESILIKNIIGKYEKKYGYKPSKQELNNLYSSGQLSLTDEEENELIKYFNEYADGGGLDNTEEIKERLEYLRGELREERISQGELIELQSLSKYIDKGDVELLEAAGVPEFDDEEFAKGGSLKKTKAKYVELLNEIGVPEHDHPEYGGRVPYKHLNTYGLWLRKNDPIAFNVGYSDWAGEDDYKKGGAIKQRGAQYERDVPYGSRDTSVQSRLVGYRYRKILDKSTGMMRKIKKTDKEYYKPVTQKDIKAYEEGDVKARKMIYQENRRDHSDKNPKNKRAY